MHPVLISFVCLFFFFFRTATYFPLRGKVDVKNTPDIKVLQQKLLSTGRSSQYSFSIKDYGIFTFVLEFFNSLSSIIDLNIDFKGFYTSMLLFVELKFF